MKTIARKACSNKALETRCYERPKEAVIQPLPKGLGFTQKGIFVLILKYSEGQRDEVG